MQNRLFTTFDADCAPAAQNYSQASRTSPNNNIQKISSDCASNNNNNKKKRTIVRPTTQKFGKPNIHNTNMMQSNIAFAGQMMQGLVRDGAALGRSIGKKKSTNMFGVSSANEE